MITTSRSLDDKGDRHPTPPRDCAKTGRDFVARRASLRELTQSEDVVENTACESGSRLAISGCDDM
jgi:hypothetical protein